MDTVIVVDVIKGAPTPWPRLESDTHLMSTGSARPLEDAFRISQVDLVQWLVAEYGIDRLDAYQLISQVSETPVANVCDPNYTFVSKIGKQYLPGGSVYGGTHDAAPRDGPRLPGRAPLAFLQGKPACGSATPRSTTPKRSRSSTSTAGSGATAACCPRRTWTACRSERRAEQWRSWLLEPGRTRTRVAGTEDGACAGFAVPGPSRDPRRRRRHRRDLRDLRRGGVRRDRPGADAAAPAPSRGSRERGFARATLWVLEGNARARRFYEREGWAAGWRREVGAARGLHDGRGPVRDLAVIRRTTG